MGEKALKDETRGVDTGRMLGERRGHVRGLASTVVENGMGVSSFAGLKPRVSPPRGGMGIGHFQTQVSERLLGPPGSPPGPTPAYSGRLRGSLGERINWATKDLRSTSFGLTLPLPSRREKQELKIPSLRS